MKKIIFTIAMLYFFYEGFAQCSATPDFVENYSSSAGWSVINRTNHPAVSNVSVSTGAVVYNSLLDGREQRIYKQLPFTLSNKAWVSECRIRISSSNIPAHLIMAFTENADDVFYSQTGNLSECAAWVATNTNQDAIFCYLFGVGTTRTVLVGHKDGTSLTVSINPGIPVPANNVNYYVRLQRTDFSVGVLSVFSDAAMTMHVAGSPQCFSITPSNAIANLKYIQHGTVTMGGCLRSATMQIDDLKIYDKESQCPLLLNPSFMVRDSICIMSPIVCNGAASTSGTSIPINDHVWLVVECDASGNNIPGATEWWSPFILGVPGTYTIPTAGGPVIGAGKYYKITLALQNCGNIWATTSRIVYIKCC